MKISSRFHQEPGYHHGGPNSPRTPHVCPCDFGGLGG
jgi:hypothetical protein